jgi:hypothetical protein
VVSVFLDSCRVWSIWRTWTVTFQAKDVRRLQQQSIVVGSMGIVAAEALHAAVVHDALNKIIPLHSVLVSCSLCEVRERSLAQLVLFQTPEIVEILADVETYRPVKILSIDWIFQRLTLRVALNASVVGVNVVQPRWIDNVRCCRMRNVFTTRAVTPLAPDVPFRYCLGLDVVVDGMATIAKRSGRPLEVCL